MKEKRLHFTFIYDFQLDMRISDVPFIYFSSSFFLLAVEMINLELFNHTHTYMENSNPKMASAHQQTTFKNPFPSLYYIHI